MYSATVSTPTVATSRNDNVRSTSFSRISVNEGNRSDSKTAIESGTVEMNEKDREPDMLFEDVLIEVRVTQIRSDFAETLKTMTYSPQALVSR